jgi:hypothetical protein
MQLPKSRMAKRGMLPKFRPATLGADAQARPSIRPVKPGPPPAPPSPARRVAAIANANHANQDDGSYDVEDQLEASTLAGSGEPSTLDGGSSPRELSFDDETQARPVDDHLLNRLRSNARDEGAAPNAPNAPADLGVDYESLPSLQVRPPFDTYERAFSERDPVTQLHAQRESARVRRAEQEAPVYNDAQRNLPSYDDEPSYPASSQHVAEEQDVWARREGSGARERPSPPPPARSYSAPVPSYDDASDSAQWGRDRAQPASARQAQQAYAEQDQHGWSSMPPQADDSQLDAPMIPPAPRVPEEMHPAFVVGVQRIRTSTPDAWGTPHVVPAQAGQYLPSPMQAIQAAMPPQYAQNPAYAYPYQYQQQLQQQAYAQAQQPMQYHQPQPTAYALSPQQYLLAGQRQPTPMPTHLSSMPPMSASVADRMQRSQPVGGQLTQPPPANAVDANSKIGRFAWFVAGAAFGITFAFFATGFFNGGKLTKDDAAVAPVATVAAAPVATVASVATVAPVAPGVAPVAPVAAGVAPVAPAAPLAPAVAPFATVPGFAPGFAPVAPQFQSQAAPAQAPAVRFAPPPPRAPRFQAPPPPRRPSAPASQSPRNLGGGGVGADDDARPSAPPAAPAGGDLGDLLGAGLKP